MVLKKIVQLENATYIDYIENKVIVSVKTETTPGSFLTGGDKFFCVVKGKVENEIQLKHHSFLTFNKGIIYKEMEDGDIFYYDFNVTDKILPSGNYFSPIKERLNKEYFHYTEIDKYLNTKHFIYNKGNLKKKLPNTYNLELNSYLVNYSKRDGIITAFAQETYKQCWIYKVEGNLRINKREKIFADEDLVFIPLMDGKLLSINITAGTFQWIWKEVNEEYLSFEQITKYIYVSFGRGIIELEKCTGKTTKIKEFASICELQSFHASGPIWCFEKVIVLIDSIYGKVVVLNYDFELVGFYEIGKPGIANSKEKIIYSEDCLYVLGMDNTLYVFEINI